MSIILGIESSCDETSASICRNGKVINNVIASQDIHSKYGGVVPELASREHQKNIVPLIDHVIKDAKISLDDLDAIAYTQGPGLLGALLVGNSFAKSLAASLDIPPIPVHHMKAHVLAHFIDEPFPKFPFLCLTVSGGHTQIIRVKKTDEMEVVGQTMDDAVGEAFDKAAKLLGLPYPGGPLIDKLAAGGDPCKFKWAESEVSEFNYSFSGIKTSILYFLRKEVRNNPDFIEENLSDLAASIQKVFIDMLMKKLIGAADHYRINQIAIAGGVAANRWLRSQIQHTGNAKGWETFVPDFQYCTDNAAMIAKAGALLLENNALGTLADIPLPRMPF